MRAVHHTTPAGALAGTGGASLATREPDTALAPSSDTPTPTPARDAPDVPALRWADGGLVSLPPLSPLDAGPSDADAPDAAVRVDSRASTPDGGAERADAGAASASGDGSERADAGAATPSSTPRLPPTASAAGGGAAQPPVASCGGASALGLCWYLGAAARSCNETCSSHGGFDARATAHVGTSRQGGSLQACARVMSALGREAPRAPAMRDDFCLGCHIYSDGVSYWLDDPSPPFTPEATGAPEQVRIACACLR